MKITDKTYTVPEIAIFGMQLCIAAQLLDDAAAAIERGLTVSNEEIADVMHKSAGVMDEMTEIIKSVVSDNIVR